MVVVVSNLMNSDGDVEAESGRAEGSASAGVEVTCTTCYVTGGITAELGFDDNYDIGQAITNFTSEIVDGIENVTSAAWDYLETEVPDALSNLTEHFDLDDVSFPPLEVSFNIDFPEIPACELHIQFFDFELYMLLDTVISADASYMVNLYSSETPLGLALNDDNSVGVVVSVDLMLAANADIDISSGLHIKVDSMALDLPLFSRNVSTLVL
ncbi:hypothetical protein ONZ43_g4848 [Nemania bipapillata]|uniref:Uncharacterized protein n=1 Tax=Nemania bipapillata TaxID=110536 RepID=A0ACC2IHM6_9PEZI|nr:hypothetical protein ONZ43_g4848 [Nemania bipapillata]